MKPPTDMAVHSDLPTGFRARRGRNWFFLGLTYASYYLCRYNLDPVAPEVMRDLHIGKSDYGLIKTGRDGAYAIGQMINGLFTDRIGGKQAMTIGAIGTIVLNLMFGFLTWGKLGGLTLAALVFVRSADGYIQAFGAPGFIKINTAWFRRRERGAFAGIFGAMINLGAVGAGKLAQLLPVGFTIWLLFGSARVPAMNWRYMFIIPPFVIAVVILLMNVFVKNTPEEAGFQIQHDEAEQHTGDERVRLRDVFAKIASNKTVWIVAGAYFCTGFVRAAIVSWWAVYLDEIWHAGKMSLLFSAFVWGLPITATLGSMASGYISDLFFNGRRAPVAVWLYLVQTLMTVAALFLPSGGGAGSAVAATILILAISTMCNSTHSILGTAAAMDLGGPRMAGCSSGIIDSFQYYGSMLSGYGVGKLFEFVYHAPAAAGTHITAPLSPSVWFGSMLPFGLLGTALMGYLWWAHRGKDTRGT